MEKFKIKIEYLPKYSPENATYNVQEWNIDNLQDARKLIIDQREIHVKKSKWFKLFRDNELIFDSHLIKR